MPSQKKLTLIERQNSSENCNTLGLAAIPDTLLQISRSGIILGFKPSLQYLPNVSSVEVVGRHVSAIMPPEMSKVLLEAIAAVLDSGEALAVELNLTQKRLVTYIEARVSKAGWESALVIIRDISDWRRYEGCEFLMLDIAAKVRQERPLGEIFELACERIKATFGDGLILIAHREAGNTMKIFTSDGEPDWLSVEGDGDITAGDDLFGAVLRTGKFQLMTIDDPRMLSWRTRLAKHHVAAGAAFPLKIDSHTLGALIVFSGDSDYGKMRLIAQLTNCAAQIALAIYATQGRQRLKLLTAGLESAANGVIIIDRKGNVEWVNQAFLKLSGYSAAEALDSNLRILESLLRLKPFYKVLRQHVVAGRVWCGEITSHHKDGSQYIAETTITPVRDETGKIANFIAIIQDITPRKQAEFEMLEAREAVAQAERLSSLGIIAAGIAHEINQPLNSLKVIADGMLYWYRKGRIVDISEAMENICEISKDADRIDMIIKHMRSFINNSDPENLVRCDINQAIEESLLLLGSQLLSHNIRVRTNFADKLPSVMGNSIQLEQIVINLLINAMHALDTVELSGKEIFILTRWRQRKGKVFLAVSDNGPGIGKAIRDKIFDPFFTTKSAGTGMGLGLSIVHSIVTAYGGQIKVTDNKPAGGVTFWIEFPRAGSEHREEDSI